MAYKFTWKWIVLRLDKDCGWEYVDGFDSCPKPDQVVEGDVIFERKYEVKQEKPPAPFLVECV